MKRIMIIGGPASGKSTLARRMGDRLTLPVYHLDKLHFLPAWQAKTTDAFDADVAAIVATDRWIIEGNYARTWHSRLARADLVIWLDIPMGKRFWRALHRSWKYHGQARPDLADGCPEQFNWQTVEFLHYIWKSAGGIPDKVDRWIRPSGVPIQRFTTNAAADTWVDQH